MKLSPKLSKSRKNHLSRLNRRVISRIGRELLDEEATEILFPPDYRDIWDFVSRPDPFEDSIFDPSFAPLRNDHL